MCLPEGHVLYMTWLGIVSPNRGGVSSGFLPLETKPLRKREGHQNSGQEEKEKEEKNKEDPAVDAGGRI